MATWVGPLSGRLVWIQKFGLPSRPKPPVITAIVGTPEEVAGGIVFLASPLARTVSGQAISVDGDLQSLVG